jgi:hypothetical protein
MPLDPNSPLAAMLKNSGITAPGGGTVTAATGTEFDNKATGLRVYTGSTALPKPTVKRPESLRDWDPTVGKGSVGTQARAEAGSTQFRDEAKALEDVQADWFSLEPDEIKRWGQLLVDNGHIDEEDMGDYSTLQKQWFAMAEEAGNLYTRGKKAVGIWDAPRFLSGAAWLGESESQRIRDLANGATGFTGSRNSVSKTVQLTDPMSAKALVNSVLARALGRDANPEELAAFTQALNGAESASPSVTNYTSVFENGEQVSQDSTTTGGLSAAGAEQVLVDRAKGSKDYGAYQAATTYFNALTEAIQSPV